MSEVQLLLALAAAIAGLFVGRIHFRLLRTGAEDLVQGGGAGRAIGLTALRFAVTLGFFGVAAILGGALPLLCGAAGFAVGRAIELRRAGDDIE